MTGLDFVGPAVFGGYPVPSRKSHVPYPPKRSAAGVFSFFTDSSLSDSIAEKGGFRRIGRVNRVIGQLIAQHGVGRGVE